MIRDFMNEVIMLKGGNPNYTIFATAGMSETKGIEIAMDLKEDK